MDLLAPGRDARCCRFVSSAGHVAWARASCMARGGVETPGGCRGQAPGVNPGPGTGVALPLCMRTLEARFHPMEREGGGFVVVGHLIWEGAGEDPRPRIQPAQSLARLSAPTTVLSILRQLVL